MNNVVAVTKCTLQTWSCFPGWNFSLLMAAIHAFLCSGLFFFFSWKSVKPYLLSLNNLSPAICTVISYTAFHHTAINHINKCKKRGNVSTTPHRPYKIYGSRRAFCPYFRTARDDDVIGIWSNRTSFHDDTRFTRAFNRVAKGYRVAIRSVWCGAFSLHVFGAFLVIISSQDLWLP